MKKIKYTKMKKWSQIKFYLVFINFSSQNSVRGKDGSRILEEFFNIEIQTHRLVSGSFSEDDVFMIARFIHNLVEFSGFSYGYI